MLLPGPRKDDGSTRRSERKHHAIFMKSENSAGQALNHQAGCGALSQLAHPFGMGKWFRSEDWSPFGASPPKGIVVSRRKMSMRSSTG